MSLSTADCTLVSSLSRYIREKLIVERNNEPIAIM